ncbi:MAG: YqjF family protein [Leadbetterella sp.]
MTDIENILSQVSHRPFDLPKGPWRYYQEWNRAVFFHWKIPQDVLRMHVPEKLILDTFEGDCYVSLVAFTMEKIRPRYVPAVSFISDFDEINLRTYIDNDNKKGVYFLSIEAGKALSAFIAKSMSGLAYEKAFTKRDLQSYTSKNERTGCFLDTEFKIGQKIVHKTALDIWLTERYCLYLNEAKDLYRYDIHHLEWELKELDLRHLELNYKIGNYALSSTNLSSVQYSEGVKVVAWGRQKL